MFRSVYLSICLWLIVGVAAADDGLKGLHPGEGSFVFDSTPVTRRKPVTVWYYVPDGASVQTPVLFVMHGMSRHGKESRDVWARLLRNAEALIFAPEFSATKYRGAEQYNLGNMAAPDEADWTYTVVEDLFDCSST